MRRSYSYRYFSNPFSKIWKMSEAFAIKLDQDQKGHGFNSCSWQGFYLLRQWVFQTRIDGMVNFLDVQCSLENSNLFCVFPDVSRVKHQGLFLVKFLSWRRDTTFCIFCKTLNSIKILFNCLSSSLYSSTDRFDLVLLIISWIAFASRNMESMSNFTTWSNSLAVVLLFEASFCILVLAIMRWVISIAHCIAVSPLEFFKVTDRISFKVLVNLGPVLFLCSENQSVLQRTNCL